MSSPTDRDVAIAARLLGAIRTPGGAFKADELATVRADARRDGFADGERAAGKASELGLWDRFMMAAMQGEIALRVPVADLARMADEAISERKKRKDGKR